MAKRTYRRYYRRNFYNRVKIMRNYFKARLDTSMRAALDTAGFKFIENNASTRNLAQVLESCSDWNAYKQLFHTFKLTGLAMEAIPNLPIAGQASPFAANGTYCVGLITQGDTTNYANLLEAKNTILLTPTQTQRKYLSFNGGETSWIATSQTSDLDGKFYTETNSLASSGGMVWSIKFSFYITFKNPN